MSTTIGLIVPPASGRLPPDGATLYGTRDVTFIAQGLGIAEVSPEGFDGAADRILEKAVMLRDQGAQSVALMGTSLTFYRGAAFTDELRAALADATGLPCTTMSHAIIASLRALGARRIAVATSYIDTLNERLADFLVAHGFEVSQTRSLGITGMDAMREVPPEALVELAKKAVEADRSADGLLISCGGLRTLGIHRQLEDELGVPVTSSAPAGLWDAMRTAGLDASAPGFGRLFQVS